MFDLPVTLNDPTATRIYLSDFLAMPCTVPGLEIAVHLFADQAIIVTYLPGNG